MKRRYLFLMLLTGLLFVGGPEAYSHRIYRALWDTGHVILYSGVIFVLLDRPRTVRFNGWVLFLIISAFCLISGFIIEVIQQWVGRNFDLNDLINDLLGGYLGLLFFIARQNDYRLWIRRLTYPLMLLIIIWVFHPLYINSIDEKNMYESFPVLSDFETPYELSRWGGSSSQLSIVKTPVRHGLSSMRIDFLAAEYPSVIMKNFPENWQDFTEFKFSIFNSQSENLTLELKIYDWLHFISGKKYRDRFNRNLILKPGWNDIRVSMNEIRSAPESRQMELSDMFSISLFLHNLKQPVTLYIDGLTLSKDYRPTN